MRDMTHSYAWHDSFICVTWLNHTCDMTHLYAWLTHLHAWNSFICVTWLMHTCDMTHLTTMLFHLHRCLKETQKPTLIVTQTHEPIHFKLAPYIQHQTSRTATQKKEMARSRNTSRSCNSSKDIHTKSIQISCDLFETHSDVSTQFARETSTYTLRAREQFVWGTFTQFVQRTHHAIGKKQQIHAICTRKQFLYFHNVSPGGFALLTPWLLLCSINMYQLRNVHAICIN